MAIADSRRRGAAALVSGLSVLVGLSGVAQGQTIGRAATVRNDVARLLGPRVKVVNVGDSVIRNDVIRTGSDSATKLVFTDNTNLAVGPNARVTLDTFVFAGGGSYKKAVINLVRGAARFTTGDSAKRAYKLGSNVATIGVRGTVLDLFAEAGRTVVTLVEGRAIVCARGTRECETISVPGQTVVVTSSGVRPGAPGEQAPNVCEQAAGLCTPTRFAEVPPRTRVGSLPPPEAPPSLLPDNPITVGSGETPADWSGFYFGGFGGYGGGSSTQHDNGYVVRTARTPAAQAAVQDMTPAATPAAATPAPAQTQAPAETTTTRSTSTGGSSFRSADGSYRLGGGLGGGLLGYNFRLARFVVGVESDIGGGSIGGRSAGCGSTPHMCGTTLSALSSVRGRVGVPLFNKVLPFVTGGPAFERISAYDALMKQTGRAWRTGYAVGGGFEYKVTSFATFRLEYLHFGFSSAHLFDIVPGVPEQISARSDVVRAGLSFNLGALAALRAPAPISARY